MVVNAPALITLIVLAVAILLLLFNITRPDLIALLILISLTAAIQINSNPHPCAMAAVLACSTAFMTPIAHPVNFLVMGPGGHTPRISAKLACH